jgi:hypothetical protein
MNLVSNYLKAVHTYLYDVIEYEYTIDNKMSNFDASLNGKSINIVPVYIINELFKDFLTRLNEYIYNQEIKIANSERDTKKKEKGLCFRSHSEPYNSPSLFY